MRRNKRDLDYVPFREPQCGGTCGHTATYFPMKSPAVRLCRAILTQQKLALQGMIHLVAMRSMVVVWLCVSLVMTDTCTATRLSSPVGQHGLEVPSENADHDSYESMGRACFEGGEKGQYQCEYGGQGGNDEVAWTAVGDAVDLGELADRVSDALVTAVGVDGDALGSVSAAPDSTPPSDSVHAIGKFSNQDEQQSRDAQEEGSLASAQRDDPGQLEPGTGETCGEGEHQRVCNKDEECCNRSCGICAPRGHSCLQIACGGLSRGGASKVRPCM